MKAIRLAIFLTAFIAFGLTASAADDFSSASVFTFVDKPGPEEVAKDNAPDFIKGATTTLELKPNSSREFFLYVRNPSKAAKPSTYIVDLKGGPGSSLASQVKVTIPGETWARVRLPKIAPPAPAAGTLPAPAAPVAAAPAEPLPPGSELATGKKAFTFTLRLLNEDGTQVIDAANEKPLGKTITVSVLNPNDYVGFAHESPSINAKGALTTVKATVIATPKFTGTSDLRLMFPTQELAKGAILREGIYKRSMSADSKISVEVEKGKVNEVSGATLSGAIEKAGENVRFHIGVDGINRAFIFKSKPGSDGKILIENNTTQAVRLISAKDLGKSAVSQPVASFPLLVEVDNPIAGASLELQVKQLGSSGDYEVIKLGGVRDERVWVDVAGPTDAGFLISNRSKDWVKSLDLTQLRGKCQIIAAMGDTKSEAFFLTVDALPPENIQFLIEKTQYKTQPVKVAITALDKDTSIAKVVFIVGKPLDDGKLPPEGLKFEGVLQKNGSWAGALALPADKRGEVYVNAVVTDQAGNSVTETTRIELVDAPPPTGDISGIVVFGEQRQPGLTVRLLVGENEKATAVTNEYGRFKFNNVPVGDYKLLVESKDASYGKAAAAEAHVIAKTTAKPTLTLIKRTK